MSYKIEVEVGDLIFLLDTLKILGQALDSSTEGFDEVEELLIESEGLINKVMEATYEESDVLRDVRYAVA